jgi:porin
VAPVFGKFRTGVGFALAASLACAATATAAKAQDRAGVSSLLTQRSLTDTPGGPKEQLRRFGIDVDVWATQFFQGIAAGDRAGVSRYGGKLDAFLKLDAEKMGLWRGLRVNVQYEHYFGGNINGLDFALVPVNAAQAFVQINNYKSALSVIVTQQFSEAFSVTVGKFNTMTLAAQTPLIGGGGIDTFMNRAFALPSTGIGVASPGTVADRLIVSPPYILGAVATWKSDPVTLNLIVADPRNAQNPRVLERPFERGFGVVGGATIATKIAGLNGFHTFRGGYSNARGFDLDDIGEVRPQFARLLGVTRKGFWLASYAVQQYLFQKDDNPSVGWGLFALGTLSDGNPNPVKWSVLAGLAGNNLVTGREADRWGVGFFHYGLTTPLLSGFAALGVERRSEGGVEAFYNWAITPWLRLSGDLQIVEPWNARRPRATYMALRLQTKF